MRMRLPRSGNHQFKKLVQNIPYLITFILPLGFLGILGIALSFLYLIFNLPHVLSMLDRTVTFTFILFIYIVSVQLYKGTLSSSNSINLTFVLILPLLCITAVLIHKNANYQKLYFSYCLGSCVFALSVIVDFALKLNELPSGLFLSPYLHNWSATIIVTAIPISVVIVPQLNISKIVKMLLPTILIVGLFCTLSWVGVLAFLLTILYLASKLSLKPKLIILVITLLLSASVSTINSTNFDYPLKEFYIRGYSINHIKQRITERFDLFQDGISRALEKPLLGWGSGNLYKSYIEKPSLTYRDQSLSHFHNVFVQFFFEYGLFGLLIFIGLLISLWKDYSPKDKTVFNSIFIAFLACQTFDFSLMQLSITLGFLILVTNKINNAPSNFSYSVTTYVISSAIVSFMFVFLVHNLELKNSPSMPVSLITLISPQSIQSNQQFSIFAGFSSSKQPYEVIVETCAKNCMRSKSVRITQAGDWWGEISKLRLTTGNHSVNIYIKYVHSNEYIIKNYNWNIHVY